MKIAAVVPAFNEEKAIAGVVSDLQQVAVQNALSLDVIVVNDCSTDRTQEVVSGLNCIALHLPVNLGIGGAMQTGFRYAWEQGYDLALQVDGDGQHPAEEIVKLLAAQRERHLDVVIGSRFLEKKGFQSSGMRRTGIGYFRKLNRLLCGLDITDSTSGFRLLSRRALELVSEYYPDEYPEPEAIILFAENDLSVGETPVTMRDRQGGRSSIGPFASVYYMWKVTLGILFTFIRVKNKVR
ncbi:MAG: glycosyltransferase family 2 protein [Bacteroidota bacterium]